MAKSSRHQNCHNRNENRSLKLRQFKGIRMRKWGKWVSEIRMPNSTGRVWLGSYDTPVKAARAYDYAVYCLRGSKAKLNFPLSPPEIPCAYSLSPPQIQAAAVKFAAEEFRLPSAALSSSSSEEECGNGGQEISVEQDPAFWDSVLQNLDSAMSLTLEDFPPLDMPLEATEEFPLSSEDVAALSSFGSEEECGNGSQESSVEQDPVFWDSVLENLDSAMSLTLEDCPPLDVPLQAAEEFLLPSEDDAALSSSSSEEECGNGSQEISVEQDPAFWDSVLEDLDNAMSLTLDDFPPLDVPLEDVGVLFQLTEECV